MPIKVLILHHPKDMPSTFMLERTPAVEEAVKKWDEYMTGVYGPCAIGPRFFWRDPEVITESEFLSEIKEDMMPTEEEDDSPPEGFEIWDTGGHCTAFGKGLPSDDPNITDTITICADGGCSHIGDRDVPEWGVLREITNDSTDEGGWIGVEGLTFEQALKVASTIPKPTFGQTETMTFEDYQY